MGAAFLVIAIAAGAAVVGRLAGPVDAVPVAFFGLWGTLLVWILNRLPAGDAADADDDDADYVGRGADPIPKTLAPAPERKPDVQIPS
jgi:hypothetical protein